MRKVFAFLLGVGLVGLIFWGGFGDTGKLSPYLRLLLAESLQVKPASLPGLGIVPPKWEVTLPFPTGEPLRVLVKLRRPFFGERFLGLPVTVSTGTILGMKLNISDLLTLIASPDVVYVEPAWKAHPTLDKSLPAIGADILHMQVPPITGKGVIIGAVDTGIDYSHLDFRYDSNGDGYEDASRILYIWDQATGAKYTRSQIEEDIANGYGPNAGVVRETDTDGHGTHVMGIAAGDGSSSPARFIKFIGVAPEAWIIEVKTTFYTDDILRGVKYIFDKAEELGLPAVVNLSLGGQEGPHDGTSLFEQGLDKLAGPGHIIVVSAGNEGDKEIHVGRTLNGDSYTFSLIPSKDSLNFALWYPGKSSFTLTVVTPGGTPVFVPFGSTDSVSTPYGNIYVDNASGGQNPNNGDNEMVVNLSHLTSTAPWACTVSGSGRFDGWITSDNGTINGGDTQETIDEPGNARHVITVGAFNTKNRWDSIVGEEDFSSQYPLGELSSFSSRGPTRDGRIKPDVAAPGAWIASSMSASSSPPDYRICPDRVHTLLLGTSVAAPHVAGTAALMLSRDPTLTADEIKDKIIRTARTDGFTGPVPNDSWGWGKLAADAAVAAVPVPHPGPGEPLSIRLTENPVHDVAQFVYTIPPEATKGKLSVYNVAGELVFSASLSPGEGSYDWDLRNGDGLPLASGLYLFVLSAGTDRTPIGKLVIER